jgi:hypothetical protein
MAAVKIAGRRRPWWAATQPHVAGGTACRIATSRPRRTPLDWGCVPLYAAALDQPAGRPLAGPAHPAAVALQRSLVAARGLRAPVFPTSITLNVRAATSEIEFQGRGQRRQSACGARQPNPAGQRAASDRGHRPAVVAEHANPLPLPSTISHRDHCGQELPDGTVPDPGICCKRILQRRVTSITLICSPTPRHHTVHSSLRRPSLA